MQKPLLIDLDGVLRIGKKPAEDIIPFLSFLNENLFPVCILSNSSLYSSKHIYKFFESHSINIKFPIITAIDAAYNYIYGKYKKVAVYTSENVIDKFSDFLEYENPEAVLIGDIGDVWNYRLIQTIFEYVQDGAELIAVHKNKFWNKPDVGIKLDAGSFIHAIEYASSSTATLIGKPSPLYFQSALNKIECDIEESFIMLGDDLDSDITGAKELGAETILIYTGKTKSPISNIYSDKIDHVANNLLEVLEILKNTSK
jgi:HAD superfamily hydrolase (TIGR01458 family)